MDSGMACARMRKYQGPCDHHLLHCVPFCDLSAVKSSAVSSSQILQSQDVMSFFLHIVTLTTHELRQDSFASEVGVASSATLLFAYAMGF